MSISRNAAVWVRRFLVGLICVYVATSLALGGHPAAETVFRSVAAAWCAGLIWYWRRHRTPKPAGRVELAASNLAVTLVVAELALAVWGSCFGKSLLLSTTIDACRLQPGHDYGEGLRGNNLGFPGRDFQREKPAGMFRIAALGDSFAVGPAVPFADNYLTLLETELPGIEVYNFGVSGAGPREYRDILRRHVWDYAPDLVLVSVFVGNDIIESLPTPRYLDPRRHAVYLLATRGWRLCRERKQPAETEPSQSPSRLAAPPLSEQTYREVEARRLEICLIAPSASLEKKWARALAYLDEIADDCRRRNTPLGLVLIPDEFQVNERVKAVALADGGKDPSALDRDLPQRRLREYCAGRGVAFLDLLPHLDGVPGAYARRDTHWSKIGNRLAARHIADFLLANFQAIPRQR